MKTFEELLGATDGHRYQAALGDLIRQRKPTVVVETGVECGCSTLHILKALDDNGSGHLYSIDPDPKLELEHPRWTLFREKSDTALPRILREVGLFDFFLHDSDHEEECQIFEYEFANNAVRDGGIIATDDHEWGVPVHGAWSRLVKLCGKEEFAIGSMRYFVK